MITTNGDWKSIAYEPLQRTRIDVYFGSSDVQYIDATRIKASPTITSALYTSKMGIGNCVSSCLQITIYAPDLSIEKASKVRMMCTVSPWESDTLLVDELDNIIVDEDGIPIAWDKEATIQIGTWYIDTREWDYAHEWLTLECYDMMAVLENYTVKQAASELGVTLSYPVTIRTAMNLISGITGLSYSTGDLPTSFSLTEDDVNRMSLRDCAGYIAAAAGANMAADETGTKIRFLPLALDLTALKGVEISDEQDDGIEDEEGGAIWYTDETNRYMFLDAQLLADLELLGLLEPIGNVRVIGEDPDTQTYHAAKGANGQVLDISWPLSSASSNLALNILNLVKGFQYRGWRSDIALIDPSLQIGDTVIVGGQPTILAEISTTIGNAYIAGCGAANDEGLTHELLGG